MVGVESLTSGGRAADVEQRLANAFDTLESLTADAETSTAELVGPLADSVSAVGSLRRAVEADDEPRIDFVATRVDGLLADWMRESERLGATSCQRAPRLRPG